MDGEELAAILSTGMKFGGLAAFVLLMLFTFGFGALVGIGQGEPVDSMPFKEILLTGFAAGVVGCLVGWLQYHRDG